MITRRVFLELRETSAPRASTDIERDGVAVLRGAFDPAEITTLRGEIEEVFATVAADARNPGMPPEERESYRYEMLNRSAACRRWVADRRLLDVVEPLLGEDCHVIANTAWRNPPSDGHLHGGGNWHVDAGPHVPRPADVPWDDRIPYPVFAVGVHVMLQDCPVECGPTGFLRGSHRSGQHPPFDRASDATLTFEGRSAEAIPAAAGDVVLFSSDIWHRRMPSAEGDTGRFFLQIHYGRRDLAQRIRTTREVNHLDAGIQTQELDERERSVLGLHRPFFYDG